MTDLPPRPPVLIGALGGSGTRVVARLVGRAGIFIGSRRNAFEDSEPLSRFYEMWMRSWLESGGAWPPEHAAEAASDFRAALAEHRHGIVNPDAPWCVKVPRSLLMLSYWHEVFPGLSFIHVVRDALDMAYSADQNQVRWFGDLVLKPGERFRRERHRAVAYWRRVNLAAQEFAQARLGPRYLLLRFEDLCREPLIEIERLYAFLSTSAAVTPQAVAEVVPPQSLGRWRQRPAGEIRKLVRLAQPARDRLGYPPVAAAGIA